jgi:hypothetical protein
MNHDELNEQITGHIEDLGAVAADLIAQGGELAECGIKILQSFTGLICCYSHLLVGLGKSSRD